MENPKSEFFELEDDVSENTKQKIVVIMGPTGSGKSKLAIDLVSHFPIEIINADSMQVYKGLDVLTNKVSPQDQKGVPHHLLGTINSNVEFTAKHFRDLAILLINEIHSRNHLPVIVGGTNYYIQALVSPFLLDDSIRHVDTNLHDNLGDKQEDLETEIVEEEKNNYNYLKEIDPIAANRIHPNDHRKINQYLNLYSRFGVLPSKFLQDKTMEKWGKMDESRYECCFICVDASLTALDEFVNQRVDRMIENGLLDEVINVYKLNSDYTRGLRQAIGVREFEEFLKYQNSESDTLKIMLNEAIEGVKLNTRRLVRRQKRRISRLKMLFGWDIHNVDATQTILSMDSKVNGVFNDLWDLNVVQPSVEIIKMFVDEKASCLNESEEMGTIHRDLWTQYVCKACGDKVLRGAHEWEQHKKGRSHRKRMCSLKKLGIPTLSVV